MVQKWTGRLLGKMHNEGVSFDDLASELGYTKAYISMIMNGKRNPSGAKVKLEQAVDTILKKREAAKRVEGVTP